ncbi:MFS transporter [Marinibaculum pumilum]|uniref:MFS transporter n=1 Tax=Marinibaculum pumilum TaxID=1766165 RepID=A0ABV7KZR5_9PROT
MAFSPAPLGRWALLGGLAGNAAGHAYVFAVLPPLGRQFGLSDMQTGLLLGLGALALILAAPAWGFAAERWGRRPVLLVGLAAAASGCLLLGLVVRAALDGDATALSGGDSLFAVLLVVRLLQSVLGGGLLPAAQAVMADTTPAAGRAGGMGRLGAAFGLGAILGAGLAWGLAEGRTGLGFMLAAALILVSLLAVARWLPEPGQPVRRQAISAIARGRLSLTRIGPFLAVTLMGVAVYALLQQVTGLRLQDAFGLAPAAAAAAAGGVLTLSAAAMVVAQALLVGWLGWSPRRLMVAGALAGLLAMMALPVVESRTALAIAMAAAGLGLGLLLPGNLASLSLRAGMQAQARAAGINAIGQGLGMVAGPVLGAALYQVAPAAPYLAAAVLLAAAGLVALLAGATERETADGR